MLLHHPIGRVAAMRPDAIAMVRGTRRVAFATLHQTSNRLAHALVARGVVPGDRVATLLPNGPAQVVAVLAAMKAGAVFVVIHPGVKSRKLAHILSDCTPRALICAGDLESALDGVATPPVRIRAAEDSPDDDALLGFADDLLDHPDSTPRDRIGADDLCYLVYTSGSTGPGKGVMMTHRNACFAADAITAYLRLSASDVVLGFSPMASDYGLYNVLMPLRVGATAVVERSYLLPGQILDAIRRERVTGLALVPTIIALFLQANGLEAQDFSTIRFVSSTGQALPPAHIRRLRQLMPGASIYSMYGLTECKRVSYLDPAEIDRRPTSVGKALAGTEVWLVDEAGRRSTASGVTGELVVRGPHVMRGYWNLPAESAERLRPGPVEGERVLYTGDLFRTDDEGFLYFVARKDDLIKSSGERISPREIEDCIYELEGVTGVVVTAVPDDVLGHAIHAVVAIAAGSPVDAELVRAHCARHLERPLVPRRVEIRDSIPVTLTGKLRKRPEASPE